MVIIAILVGLFLLYFFVKRHFGPSLLAIIAGLSVYDMFGVDLVNWLHGMISQMPEDIIQSILFAILVFLMPLLLYLRSSKGGLPGILRIIETAVMATLLTALFAPIVAKYCQFDGLSHEIANFINNIRGILVMVAAIFAYVDILLYQKHE